MPYIDLEAARQEMLRSQLRRRGIVDRRVLAAMGKVPRERFIPDELQEEAYADRALPIDCCQTISQPYIVGLMTEALELSGDERVLEIGTGSGYQTAVLAELVREVVSIERHEALSQQAAAVLSELGYRNVALIVGDGTQGCAGRSPFDRILVTAAAPECPPALFDQLGEGGILVIPLGGRDYQVLQAIEKVAAGRKTRTLSACRFVPLIGEQGWSHCGN
ncbi:MAG TPA: protein-L-isoaspartate(D-aspartate) O-methyltransferase [Thermoguttaceae bacterium]|nr:protein-L-isoaspartate(D-aspartate) O-methyltransferase [Thermoguttaceae bacterium]